jgi:hypothetical protein
VSPVSRTRPRVVAEFVRDAMSRTDVPGAILL